MPKVKNYVNNKDLTACIVQYQKDARAAAKLGLPQPIMPKYIGECITQICWRLTKGNNVAGRFDFGGYTYHDEMVNDAIERCVYAVMKFKAHKCKVGAFGYLTTVAINAKKKRIKDEKKQHAILHKNFQWISLFQGHLLEGHKPNELSEKVVGDYEEKAAAKKALTNQNKKNKMRAKVKA